MASGGSNGGEESSAFSFELGSTVDSNASSVGDRAHAYMMRVGETSSDEALTSVAPSGFDRSSQRELFPVASRMGSVDRERSRESRGRSLGPRHGGGHVPSAVPQGTTGSSGLNGGGHVPASVPATNYTFGNGPCTGITGAS